MVEVRCGRASEELREEEVDVDPRRRWSVTRGVVDQRSNNISNICERKTWLVEVKRVRPFEWAHLLDFTGPKCKTTLKAYTQKETEG